MNPIRALLDLWAREPVVITTIATAVIALLAAWNVPVGDDQKAAVVGIIAAIGVLIARSRVTPA